MMGLKIVVTVMMLITTSHYCKFLYPELLIKVNAVVGEDLQKFTVL